MESQSLWLRDQNGAAAATLVQQEYPPVTSRGLGLVIVGALMPTIATAWTGLRVWTRRIRGISPFLAEDIFCYAAVLCFWGIGIGYICMVVIGGAGHHTSQLRPLHVSRFSKALFTEEVLYTLTLGFTKISIITMIKRIFFEHSYAYVPNGIMAFCIAWMLQGILTAVLICVPISVVWDPNAYGHCGNLRMGFAAIGIVDIVTDICILALPIKMVLGLHMKVIYKIALGCAFGAGIITIVFTSLRLYFLLGINFNDLIYSCIRSSIITTVQLGVAIIVASSPLLRPVFDRTIGRMLGHSLSSSSHNTPKSPSSTGTMSSDRGSGVHMIQGLSESTRNGFKPMSESEENLQWEMNVMHTERGKTETYITRSQSDEESNGVVEEPPEGRIRITQFTEIS